LWESTPGRRITNVRASGSDEAIKLLSPKRFTLEEGLEFIEEDELLEITPDALRVRKKILGAQDRMRAGKKSKS